MGSLDPYDTTDGSKGFSTECKDVRYPFCQIVEWPLLMIIESYCLYSNMHDTHVNG